MITNKKDLNVYRADSGLFYYVFQVPARYNGGKVGKQVRRSSGKGDEASAREVAWQDYLKVCGLSAAVEGPRQAFKSVFPTVGEVCRRYLEVIHVHSQIEVKSARDNVRSLVRILKRVGLDAERVRVDQLTAQMVLESRKAFYAEREEEWSEQDGGLNYTLNSELNQAKSVLGKRAGACYEGWRPMPEKIGLFAVPRLNQKDAGFLGIAHIGEMDRAAAVDLRGKSAVAWVAYELARWGGLRAGEIAAFQGSWLARRGDGWVIEVRPRAGREMADGVPWKPKRNKARNVPLKGERVEAWVEALGGAWPTGFLVPGSIAYHRMDWLGLNVNAWLAPFLQDRDKRLHELRKQIGSEVYTSQGAPAAAEFLGDTLETTMKHYAKFLGTVKAM